MNEHYRIERAALVEGPYRYTLWRRWSDELPLRVLPVVMCNPSTADGDQDDATIRRLYGFAKREGYGALEVVNLFAWRATNPMDLRRALDDGRDIRGPYNDLALSRVGGTDRPVLVAWGGSVNKLGAAGKPMVLEAATKLTEARSAGLVCLGVTVDGHPRHPLYLRADIPLQPWSPQALLEGPA